MKGCGPSAEYCRERETRVRGLLALPRMTPKRVRFSEHEYEPIGQPVMRMAISQHSMSVRMVAPVVKITDTDMIPAVDSDDSIDDRYRFKQRALILEGDVVLPLDGRIEDSAMDGRNLGDQTIDTSADELESPQQPQNRLEESFQMSATPGAESRTDAEINTSQVDSSMIEELPLRRGASGLQQRLKTSAGKIRSRFKNIQKPTFSMPHMPHRQAKTEKPTTVAATSTTTTAEKPPASPRPADQKASRMERFRMALPERPRFSLPDKSKFHLPDRSRFHLPDRSKFHLPERPKFNIDRSKFHMKKPNIQLPKSLSRPKRCASQRGSLSREQSQASNADASSSTSATRRNIFDFSTYPRPKLFERKSKAKAEYVTSSPKESRAQSSESSTFPRANRSSLSLSARWAQRFGETVKGIHHDDSEPPVDRSKPWRHPSLEEPRLSLKPQTSQEEEEEEEEKLPWENSERRTYDAEDEEESREASYGDRSATKAPELSFDKEPVKDPRLYDEQLMTRIVAEEPKKKVRLVEEDEASLPDPEAEDEHHTYHPKELFDGSFPPVDPREFRVARENSVDLSEDEGSSMRSDREIQQSSGSSCERRRRGVIEEIDSDEFFLREKGISQENMRFTLISEISSFFTQHRDALRPRVTAEIEEIPPQRPKRTRSLRKRRDESVESYDATPPPEKPKRERSSLRQSRESFHTQPSLERVNSLSRHRIVYQTETAPMLQTKDDMASEPLDDIVVVKPARRKSRSSLRSTSQSRLPPEEQNIVLAPMQQSMTSEIPTQVPVPPVPRRRKRLRRDNTNQSSSLSVRTSDSALCNGFHDTGSLRHSHERIPPTPPPTPPPPSHPDELDYIEPAAAPVTSHPPPVPPKRTRSHSRTASLAPEDDRTSHGAESLPGDFGYADEDDIPVIPRDSSSREPSLPGYAVIEKREKPPRPPPPRRKRQDKFATAPRPSKNGGPKRPLRAYSTLRPAKSDTIRKSVESIPFMDADYSLHDREPQPVHNDDDDDDFHKDLRSGEVLSKMQGRPLPAPPRPPRHRRVDRHTRRSLPREITPDFSETVASTQTDPLPDDLVIEEEITSAKLVVTPSRHGSSQVLISTERVPSPTNGSYKSLSSGEPKTPPIPPLPSSVQQRDPVRTQAKDTNESDYRVPSSGEPRRLDPSQLEMLRSALFSSEGPLRIPSLEVGDLKVERLTVSQLEAYKVAASEIDAIVVSATELSNRGDTEGGIHPSLLQELIAIRNQLEAVAASQPQSRPQSAMEDACTATSNERIDMPLEESSRAAERRRSFTRERSPLLVVEQSLSGQEATKEMGRTSFPLSGSTTDLTLVASDSPSVSEVTTTFISTEATEEPVITITEAPVVQPSLDIATDDKLSSPRTTSPESRLTRSSSPSRSRSSSPSRGRPGVVRQTASPVKSLPPVISVTPDNIVTPTSTLPTGDNDNNMPLRHVTSSGVQPQRAVISYQSSNEPATTPSSLPPSRETSQSPPPPVTRLARESSRSPPPPSSPPQAPTRDPDVQTRFIAFPTSQIPASFFALADPPLSSSVTDQQQHQQRRDVEVEPSIADMSGQLLRALRHAGTRSLRHFVDSVVSRFASPDEVEETGVTSAAGALSEEKVRRIELAMCALLILIAGLIIMCICTPRTVTHHHHWDYFNPPQ
ncbi:titin isoform X3 [Nasonia vitripennis]|uniref:Uncharacterized protein n=1 Tax=Nasonia vitripennis TaxID=7425 RepID=A0A7M7T6A5_NASVI|nr:titin isoform X3 [Nasonia vitripennis]